MSAILQQVDIAPIMDRTGFQFTTADMNSLARRRYMDVFEFWQRMFGVYGWMKINQLFKFTVYSPKGYPLGWQEYKSCAYDETGQVTLGKRELSPSAVYWRTRFCHDELLDSCFKHFLRFNEDSSIGLTADGNELIRAVSDEIIANAGLSARYALTSGNFYDLATTPLSVDNTAKITADLNKTYPAVTGWVKLVFDLAAAGKPWLNQTAPGSAADFDGDGNYVGDILVLFDNLKKGARSPMRQLVNQGIQFSAGGVRSFAPLFVLSDSYFNAVVQAYNDQATQIATNRVRITQVSAPNASGMPSIYYMIDGRIPIVPLSDICGFDEFLGVQTHYAGLVASGNIQLGWSFSDIPDNIENKPVAMQIGRVTDITRSDLGMWTFLSHALMVSSIADADFMSSVIVSTVK